MNTLKIALATLLILALNTATSRTTFMVAPDGANETITCTYPDGSGGWSGTTGGDYDTGSRLIDLCIADGGVFTVS